MPGQPSDPISAFSFALEIQGLDAALFREASGFGSESQIVEFKQQGPKGQTYVHKIPGTMKWQNIVLKRGITDSLHQLRKGKVSPLRIDPGSGSPPTPRSAHSLRHNQCLPDGTVLHKDELLCNRKVK